MKVLSFYLIFIFFATMSVVSDIFFATMRQKHQEVYYAETHPTLHHNDLSLFRDVSSNNEIPLITSAYITFC